MFPNLLPGQGSHSCFLRLLVSLPQPLPPSTCLHVGLEAVGLWGHLGPLSLGPLTYDTGSLEEH